MSEATDIAIVIKALELRAESQGLQLAGLYSSAESALIDIRHERDEWRRLASALAPNGDSFRIVPNESRREIGVHILSERTVEWSGALRDARAVLESQGVSSEDVNLELPQSLTAKDVAAAIAIGCFCALLPSIGNGETSIRDSLNQLQKAADRRGLPDAVQQIFGQKTPAAFMDAGAAGPYHRFVHGHDLFWAVPEGVRQLGLVNGLREVFQHVMRDACGLTGIPLPGSTQFASVVTESLGLEIRDLISPRDLSRYSGFRMTDAVATGATELLLWLYRSVSCIESGSIKAAKLGVIAHGICFASVAIASVIPPLAPLIAHRSHLNYVSLLALTKHGYTLHRATTALRHENQMRFRTLEAELASLREVRSTSTAPRLHTEILRVAAASPELPGMPALRSGGE